MIHVDTHVLVWLFAGDIERFPPNAQDRLERDDLMISPMVSLELTYLHEIGRITASAEIILDDLRHRVGLSTSRTAFEAVIAQAQTLSFTRDPFDRIIAANALTDACPLLTADERMRSHVPGAVWD